MAQKVEIAGKVEVDDLIVTCSVCGPICSIFGCFVMDIQSLYLKFPECLGCYLSNTCCYFKFQEVCCKKSNIYDEFCVCDNCRCVNIMPTNCCSGTNQCLCCDYRYECPVPPADQAEAPCMFNILGCMICLDGNFKCGLCQSVKTLRNGEVLHPFCPCVLGYCAKCDCMSSEKTYNKKEDTIQEEEAPLMSIAGKTELGDLKPFLALCCQIVTCFCKIPDVFGCYRNCTICCCRDECIYNKPAVQKGEIFTGEIYVLCDRKCAVVQPKTCCVAIAQVFCCDVRAAFPCDGDNVPCIFNLLYWNICFDWKQACGFTYFEPLSQFMGGQKNLAVFKSEGAVRTDNSLVTAQAVEVTNSAHHSSPYKDQ